MRKDAKRILVLANDVTGGGAERVAETQMRLLHGCVGLVVAAATCGAEPAVLGENSHYRLRHFLETPWTRVAGTLGAGLNRAEMRRCLTEFHPDLVHMHAFVQFSPGALAELLAFKRETGCRVFLTHHTYNYVCPNDALFTYHAGAVCEKCVGGAKTHILYDRCYGSALGSIGKYLQKRRFYRIFRNGLVDVHIAPGEFMRDVLLREDPNLTVEVVSNPCLRGVRQTIPRKTNGKITYFGRMSREKNVAALVAAMEMLQEPYRLLLVGDGPESDSLERQIRESAARERIRFCRGFLPAKELYETIRDAQYYVLPSIWYENSPVAIIEALDLGMIPLVSGIGGMRELIEHIGIGDCFEPGRADAIARTVRRAMESGAGELQMADTTRRQRLEGFTEARFLEKTLSLYERWE